MDPTSDTATPVIGEATLADLRDAVVGDVLAATDQGFDDARRVWNGAIDRHPAVVARCTGTTDVIAALEFARSKGLPIAVRAGGHNLAGFGTCDGGLVLDLSPMKGTRVDPAAGTVQAQGGVVWGELGRETQAFGYATTGGLVSTTGVAVFTPGRWHRLVDAMAALEPLRSFGSPVADVVGPMPYVGSNRCSTTRHRVACARTGRPRTSTTWTAPASTSWSSRLPVCATSSRCPRSTRTTSRGP